MKGRSSGQNILSSPLNLSRVVAATLIFISAAASANAQISGWDNFRGDASLRPPNTPRFSPSVFDAASGNALQGCDVNTVLTLSGNSPAASDGDFPSDFLYFIPQGAGNALPLTLAPNAAAYPLMPGTLPLSTSSSTPYAAAPYFSSRWQFTSGQSDAGGRAGRSLPDDEMNLDFRTTASAAEPSAVGFALAPFVFAGAAYVRRRMRRNRKKK